MKDYLCECTNCDVVLIDTNPTQGGGSTKFKIKYRIEDAF